MKRILADLLIVFFILGGSAPNLSAGSFAKRPQWSMEFSSLLWKRRLNNFDIHKGKFASDQEYYTDSLGNVFIKNGYLHLKATSDKREDKLCSSGRVSTKGFKSFLYGKIEIRAKVPTGKGIFPAIWMLREDHPKKWPIGEIDIMEYIDCFEGVEYATTIHLTHREKGLSSDPIKFTHTTRNKTNIESFHIYGLEWTPETLTFTLDSKPYYTLDKDTAEYWPFDVPYVLILNVAYGNWGAKCGMDDSIFPCEMLVDWIRYYPLIR